MADRRDAPPLAYPRPDATMVPMPNLPVELGQRYRDIQPGAFGTTRTEWIVERIFESIDGLQHARLVSASDLTQEKSLSVDVLLDRRRFQRV